jgi:hypothetical protein
MMSFRSADIIHLYACHVIIEDLGAYMEAGRSCYSEPRLALAEHFTVISSFCGILLDLLMRGSISRVNASAMCSIFTTT